MTGYSTFRRFAADAIKAEGVTKGSFLFDGPDEINRDYAAAHHVFAHAAASHYLQRVKAPSAGAKALAGLHAAFAAGEARVISGAQTSTGQVVSAPPVDLEDPARNKVGIARVGVKVGGESHIAFIPSLAARVLNSMEGGQSQTWTAETLVDALRSVAVRAANGAVLRTSADESGTQVPMLVLPMNVWHKGMPVDPVKKAAPAANSGPTPYDEWETNVAVIERSWAALDAMDV